LCWDWSSPIDIVCKLLGWSLNYWGVARELALLQILGFCIPRICNGVLNMSWHEYVPHCLWFVLLAILKQCHGWGIEALQIWLQPPPLQFFINNQNNTKQSVTTGTWTDVITLPMFATFNEESHQTRWSTDIGLTLY
jgi:hypothetical protein